MSLGNFDISSFKPRKSQTAAQLLSTAPNREEKKTERVQIRIQYDLFLAFKDICENQGTDVSKALRSYIVECVTGGSL